MAKKIYLDSCFLLSLFVPHHQLQRPAMQLYARLKTTNYKLYISPLTVNETWYGYYDTWKKQQPQSTISTSAGISTIASTLKQMLDLIKGAGINLIELKQPIDSGVKRALEIITNYSLRPGDAFHLTIAESRGITEIATNDSHFNRVTAQNSPFTIQFF